MLTVVSESNQASCRPLALTGVVSVCEQGTWGHSPEAQGVMWGWGILGSFSPGSLYHVVEVLTLLLLVVLLFLHDGCPLSTLCLHVHRQGLGDDTVAEPGMHNGRPRVTTMKASDMSALIDQAIGWLLGM